MGEYFLKGGEFEVYLQGSHWGINLEGWRKFEELKKWKEKRTQDSMGMLIQDLEAKQITKMAEKNRNSRVRLWREEVGRTVKPLTHKK